MSQLAYLVYKKVFWLIVVLTEMFWSQKTFSSLSFSSNQFSANKQMLACNMLD